MTPETMSPKINTEERHKAHQQMLEQHKEEKAERRERHRKGWHKRKTLPITLV